MNRLVLVLVVAFTSICGDLMAQSKVEIIGGEKLSYDQIKNHRYIVGNVVIRHDGVIIQCDSAIHKADEGLVEGYGHIYIYQPDTFTLSGGDYLRYDEASKTALVTGKEVILRDKSMTLLTTSINYNIKDQVGYYTNGADILNEQNTLKSRKGYYNRRSNIFHFKEKVNLKSPDYTMDGDTLDYYASTRTAYFYGPTTIVSKENTIFCKSGWYNTVNETAQFSKGAEIHGKKSFLSADSLYYDRKKGLGLGKGNIMLIDSGESMTIYGQKGRYLQNTKESFVSESPMAMQAKDKDTLYVLSDTFYFRNDSIERIMRAFGNTKIYQKEMQGKCDSLVYKFKDSLICMFDAPILWNKNNQITGDTIFIQLKNNKIHSMKVREDAFLASEVKPLYYNQIAGKEMINYFDSNKLKSVLVEGNAQSIYYLRDNETDSAEYTGINKVSCGKMLILMDSSKVSGIKFYNSPEGKMYPMDKFPDTEKYLPGLDWKIKEKPNEEQFLERTKRKEIKYDPNPVPQKPVKDSKKIKKKKSSKKST